jgi:predicted metal-dependent peptidase
MIMSEINENKVSFAAPSSEDEGAKHTSLEDWTNDRMKLLSWRPFIGTLAMNLELIPVVDHRCPTAATDGKRVFFNPHFLNNLNEEERLTILAHEIWHCGLSHFLREHGRIEDHEMWNHAIDHEVNSLLEDDGFKIPVGAILYRPYKGESAETVFELIKTGKIEMRGKCLDDHGNSAAQQCNDRGTDMGNYQGHLDDLFSSKMPWKEILRQFLTPMFNSTRRWLPPNRRYVYKKMYLPSIQKEKQLNIVIAIDTSGSTTGDIVKTFVSEVYAILNSFGGYQLRLIQCDMHVQEDVIYDMDKPFVPDDFKLKGGGGTDFHPVFDLINESEEHPEVVLYLTDGYGQAPKSEPSYPVIWGVIEGGVVPAKWGQSFDIDLGN